MSARLDQPIVTGIAESRVAIIGRASVLVALLGLVAVAVAAPASATHEGGAPHPPAGSVELITNVPGGTAIAFDGAGRLVFTTQSQILRLAADGSSYAVIADGVTSSDVAADPSSGDVYFVANPEIRRVRDGRTETVAHGTAASWMAFAPDGTLHYIDEQQRIRRVAPDGSVETVTEIDDDIRPIVAFAIASDGDFVLADEYRVWRSDEGRTFDVIAGSTPCPAFPDPCGDGGPARSALFSSIRDLAFDAEGNLFVVTTYRVRVIEVDGRVRHVAGSWTQPYQACGRFDGCGTDRPAQDLPMDPVGIAVRGDDIVLAEVSGRVLRVHDVLAAPRIPTQGYRMIAADGGVFTFGWSPFHGSTGDLQLVSPIVAAVSNGAGGYWFVAGDGGVFTFGDAPFLGSAVGRTTSPVVDMARAADSGYWVLERNGAVHAFGAAPFCGHARLLGPFAAIVDSPDGLGYALVAEDGRQYGLCRRPGGAVIDLPALNAPIVAAHRTASGEGLWMVAADGGVFTQGDAGFFGSTGAMRLNQPVLDLVPTPSGLGYWLIAADGGVFTFGDARFMGSMGAVRLNRPVVAGVAGPAVSG